MYLQDLERATPSLTSQASTHPAKRNRNIDEKEAPSSASSFIPTVTDRIYDPGAAIQGPDYNDGRVRDPSLVRADPTPSNKPTRSRAPANPETPRSPLKESSSLMPGYNEPTTRSANPSTTTLEPTLNVQYHPSSQAYTRYIASALLHGYHPDELSQSRRMVTEEDGSEWHPHTHSLILSYMGSNPDLHASSDEGAGRRGPAHHMVEATGSSFTKSSSHPGVFESHDASTPARQTEEQGDVSLPDHVKRIVHRKAREEDIARTVVAKEVETAIRKREGRDVFSFCAKNRTALEGKTEGVAVEGGDLGMHEISVFSEPQLGRKSASGNGAAVIALRSIFYLKSM